VAVHAPAARGGGVSPRQMNQFVSRLEKAQHRAMIGTLVAGLAISSAILMATDNGWRLGDVNLLNVLGAFGMIGVWGGVAWLLLSMLQSRKDRYL
jgi:hypothetical protein